jgi:hypothetical protein
MGTSLTASFIQSSHPVQLVEAAETLFRRDVLQMRGAGGQTEHSDVVLAGANFGTEWSVILTSPPSFLHEPYWRGLRPRLSLLCAMARVRGVLFCMEQTVHVVTIEINSSGDFVHSGSLWRDVESLWAISRKRTRISSSLTPV